MRIAARCCFTLGFACVVMRCSMYAATWIGWIASSESLRFRHHAENCEAATKYARRVFRFRMFAVKNSQKRFPA
jgi:hypothetical protein